MKARSAIRAFFPSHSLVVNNYGYKFFNDAFPFMKQILQFFTLITAYDKNETLKFP